MGGVRFQSERDGIRRSRLERGVGGGPFDIAGRNAAAGHSCGGGLADLRNSDGHCSRFDDLRGVRFDLDVESISLFVGVEASHRIVRLQAVPGGGAAAGKLIAIRRGHRHDHRYILSVGGNVIGHDFLEHLVLHLLDGAAGSGGGGGVVRRCAGLQSVKLGDINSGDGFRRLFTGKIDGYAALFRLSVYIGNLHRFAVDGGCHTVSTVKGIALFGEEIEADPIGLPRLEGAGAVHLQRTVIPAHALQGVARPAQLAGLHRLCPVHRGHNTGDGHLGNDLLCCDPVLVFGVFTACGREMVSHSKIVRSAVHR